QGGRSRRAARCRRPRAVAAIPGSGSSVHSGEIVAQVLGTVQVDMAQMGSWPRRVAVEQEPDGVRVAADDVQLAGTEQRHVAEPELTGREGRERAPQIPGR